MSKASSKWHALILAEFAIRDRFKLRELLGVKFSRTGYDALNRVALILEDAGKINLHRGGGEIYVHRIGTTFTAEDRRKYEG